jgi:carboxyl-terminal processing protease
MTLTRLSAQALGSLSATEPTVRGVARGADNNWTYLLDEKNRIAYVQLSAFAEQTNKELERLLRTLVKGELKGLVLDLRFNAGGSLPAVVKTADLLIDDGLIVTIRPQAGPETSYVGKSDGSYLTFPIACLINRDTAAGAEFLAACLQDHARAVLFGERTMGQAGRTRFEPKDAPAGPQPAAVYIRPSGKNLHKAATKGRPDQDWGVRPDPGNEVVLTDGERAALLRHLGQAKRAAAAGPQDRQLERAIEYLRLKIGTPAKKAN